MKSARLGLVLLLVASFATTAFAGEQKPYGGTAKSPDDMAKNALNKWKNTLKLTPEQIPQFESVMKDSYKKLADARAAAAGDKEKMKASMQTIFTERDAQLAKILTADQMKTYRQKLGEASNKAKSHWGKSASHTSK